MGEEPKLTEREIEILEQLATGASNRQIARRLNISANTVKVHLRNIYQKLAVTSRTEATVLALQSGLIEVAENDTSTPLVLAWWRKNWVLPTGGLLLVAAAIAFTYLATARGGSPSGSIDVATLERERWHELSPLPTARVGMAVAAHDGQIYVIGGESENGVTGVVERYDPESDTWATLPSKPTAVTDVRAGVIAGKIYVPGGCLASGKATNTLEAYDPHSGQWEAYAPLPHAVCRYALAAREGRLYLFGGTDEDGPLASVWIYSAAEDAWRPGESMPGMMAGAAAAALPDGVLVAGSSGSPNDPRAVLLYQPEMERTTESAWTVRSDLLVAGTDMSAAGFENTVYVFGGTDRRGNAVVQKYSAGEDVWQMVAMPIQGQWSAPGVSQVGNDVFLIGGRVDGMPSSRTISYKAVFTVLLPIVQ